MRWLMKLFGFRSHGEMRSDDHDEAEAEDRRRTEEARQNDVLRRLSLASSRVQTAAAKAVREVNARR